MFSQGNKISQSNEQRQDRNPATSFTRLFNFEFNDLIQLLVARRYFEKFHEPIYVMVGLHPDYDLASYTFNWTAEVKFDAMATSTGNLCIEIGCNGRPSGLSSTKAYKWVHLRPLSRSEMLCYEFDVKVLREFVKRYSTRKGGDNQKSVMKLIPFDEAETLACDKFTLKVDWSQFQPYW
jgi:hypothetical protein